MIRLFERVGPMPGFGVGRQPGFEGTAQVVVGAAVVRSVLQLPLSELLLLGRCQRCLVRCARFRHCRANCAKLGQLPAFFSLSYIATGLSRDRSLALAPKMSSRN